MYLFVLQKLQKLQKLLYIKICINYYNLQKKLHKIIYRLFKKIILFNSYKII